nr:hypothetical protein [Tanacetum cinerariifolium]GFA87670.1 hypothetical protein [Tanacetum cinerariifolium]
MDLDSPKDDQPIIVQENDEEEVTDKKAKTKTLDALPSLISKVTKALDRFAQAAEQASHKAGGQ